MFALLLILALLLPFELTRPLFFVGSIGITSVELPLYALIVLSVVRRQPWRPSAWTLVHWAALAWAVAHLASAASVEVDRGSAMRFALRMSIGAALVFPVSATTRAPGRAARVLVALVAGAILSATLAVAEAFLPGAAPLLAPFKTVTARVAATLRAGGPFQYPNPAALYWGAALPSLLALDAWAGQSGHVRFWTVAGGGLLAAAVVATGSRGGLLAVAVVLGLLSLVRAGSLRRSALVVLAGLAAAVVVFSWVHPALMLRDSILSGEAPWFAGRFELLGPAPEIGAGQEARVRVQARNVGTLVWDSSGPTPMALGAQWLDAEGRIVHEDFVTPIQSPVAPGATALLDAQVTAPEHPGRYRLRWQLVLGGTSFESSAAASGDVPISIAGPPFSPARSWPVPRPTQRQVTRLELWRAGWRMWRERPLLGVGPDGFRRLYSGYLGPRLLDVRVNANSLYVETLADLGLAGVVALGFVFAALCGAAWVAWPRGGGPVGWLVVGPAAALATFALHGIVDSVLAFTPLYGLFWIHAGLLAGRAEPTRAPSQGRLPDQRNSKGA